MNLNTDIRNPMNIGNLPSDVLAKSSPSKFQRKHLTGIYWEPKTKSKLLPDDFDKQMAIAMGKTNKESVFSTISSDLIKEISMLAFPYAKIKLLHHVQTEELKKLIIYKNYLIALSVWGDFLLVWDTMGNIAEIRFKELPIGLITVYFDYIVTISKNEKIMIYWESLSEKTKKIEIRLDTERRESHILDFKQFNEYLLVLKTKSMLVFDRNGELKTEIIDSFRTLTIQNDKYFFTSGARDNYECLIIKWGSNFTIIKTMNIIKTLKVNWGFFYVLDIIIFDNSLFFSSTEKSVFYKTDLNLINIEPIICKNLDPEAIIFKFVVYKGNLLFLIENLFKQGKGFRKEFQDLVFFDNYKKNCTAFIYKKLREILDMVVWNEFLVISSVKDGIYFLK